MAFEAQFHHGDPLMVDHTPGTAVSAGQVVVIGDAVLIAHRDIAANELGALASGGGAVYDVAKEAPLVIADGVLIYWDDTNNRVTTNAAAGANKRFGNARGSALSADVRMKAVHRPA